MNSFTGFNIKQINHIPYPFLSFITKVILYIPFTYYTHIHNIYIIGGGSTKFVLSDRLIVCTKSKNNCCTENTFYVKQAVCALYKHAHYIFEFKHSHFYIHINTGDFIKKFPRAQIPVCTRDRYIVSLEWVYPPGTFFMKSAVQYVCIYLAHVMLYLLHLELLLCILYIYIWKASLRKGVKIKKLYFLNFFRYPYQ